MESCDLNMTLANSRREQVFESWSVETMSGVITLVGSCKSISLQCSVREKMKRKIDRVAIASSSLSLASFGSLVMRIMRLSGAVPTTAQSNRPEISWG